MPLCSCGVIPAAVGIRQQGAGKGASIGFLVSTPQTGVDSILVSAAMLSWPFALFKLASAFVLGLVGGLISDKFDSESDVDISRGSSGVAPERSIKEVWNYGVNDLLYMIWRWLFIGVLLSAAISTWVDAGALQSLTSGSLFLSLLIVLVISVPLYVCATSSVPVAAALVAAGMPVSAALVFLIAGPATNVATIGAVYRAFGKRHLLIYLGTVIIGSVGLAWCFDFVISVGHVHSHDHGGGFYSVFAVLLSLLFVKFAIKDLRQALRGSAESGETLTLYVEGLKCKGCVNKLRSAVEESYEVSFFAADLEDGKVEISAAGLDSQQAGSIVESCGFFVKKKPQETSCCNSDC